MAEECCTPGGNIMILACSGGSNVGQLSNQAAIELTQEGFGCELGCAKAILEHAEIPAKNYLVLTDLGIEKNKDFNLKAEDIQKVKAAIRSACE